MTSEVWTVHYEDQIGGIDGVASTSGPPMSRAEAETAAQSAPYVTEDGRTWRKAEAIKVSA